MAHIPPSSSVCHLDSGILKKKKRFPASLRQKLCVKGVTGWEALGRNCCQGHGWSLGPCKPCMLVLTDTVSCHPFVS